MRKNREAKLRLLQDISPMIYQIKQNLNSLNSDCKIKKWKSELI